MNILVLGSGAAGSIAAKILAGFNNIAKIIVGDINEKNAKKFLVPDPKIEFKIIDAAKKEEVLEILSDLVSQHGYWEPNKRMLKVKTFYDGPLYRYGFGGFLVLCGILQMGMRRMNRLVERDAQDDEY